MLKLTDYFISFPIFILIYFNFSNYSTSLDFWLRSTIVFFNFLIFLGWLFIFIILLFFLCFFVIGNKLMNLIKERHFILFVFYLLYYKNNKCDFKSFYFYFYYIENLKIKSFFFFINIIWLQINMIIFNWNWIIVLSLQY